MDGTDDWRRTDGLSGYYGAVKAANAKQLTLISGSKLHANTESATLSADNVVLVIAIRGRRVTRDGVTALLVSGAFRLGAFASLFLRKGPPFEFCAIYRTAVPTENSRVDLWIFHFREHSVSEFGYGRWAIVEDSRVDLFVLVEVEVG